MMFRTYQECLDAVKHNGRALCFVPAPFMTEELVLMAVTRTPTAISMVKNQTHAICLESVKRWSGATSRFVVEITVEFLNDLVALNADLTQLPRDSTFDSDDTKALAILHGFRT